MRAVAVILSGLLALAVLAAPRSTALAGTGSDGLAAANPATVQYTLVNDRDNHYYRGHGKWYRGGHDWDGWRHYRHYRSHYPRYYSDRDYYRSAPRVYYYRSVPRTYYVVPPPVYYYQPPVYDYYAPIYGGGFNFGFNLDID